MHTNVKNSARLFSVVVVLLTLTSCGQIVKTPDVYGMDELQARATLLSYGLDVGTVTEQYDDIVSSGNVVDQNPAAGTPIQVGGLVDLVLSAGPESKSGSIPTGA